MCHGAPDQLPFRRKLTIDSQRVFLERCLANVALEHEEAPYRARDLPANGRPLCKGG